MCRQPEPANHLRNVSAIATPDYTPLRTLLVGFPARPDTWRHNARPAQHAILSFVSQVLQHTNETVTIITSSTLSLQSQKLVNRFRQTHHTERLSVITLPMDDCWLRDIGPVFTSVSKLGIDQVIGTCFKFNAWGGLNGGCYTDYTNDALFNERLCHAFCIPITKIDTVLEGGSISSDGQGTIITTEECLLHQNRNPHMSKLQIEGVLQNRLGARKVIWLPYGAAYDHDTDGHVDNIAVFARPGHVVLAYGGCEEQRRRSTAAAMVLEGEHDAEGRRMVVHKVPTPLLCRTSEEAKGVQRATGVVERNVGRICASYVNFVICGSCVFVPRFGVGEDHTAETVLKKAFSDRHVVMVDAREFVLAGGGLRCLTLGVPR